MQTKSDIIDCYNKTSFKYSEKFASELEEKVFESVYLRAFADRNCSKENLLDVGCGPGHITQYLKMAGCESIIGLDLSPGMIETAVSIYPDLSFQVGDMLQLEFEEGSVGGIVALYSIIHFDYTLVEKAFQEIWRVLAYDAELLISFHIGDTVLHQETFLEEKVKIDFYMLEVDKIKKLLENTGYKILEIIERYPHPEIEYQSKRAYFLSKKQR